MVRARVALLGLALVAAGFVPGSAPAAGPVRQNVTFTVTNPLAPLKAWKIHGEMILPSAGCSRGVLLAMHGLSYGAWAWDFPLRPETYSVAQALAARGYAMVAVDELGYGDSSGGVPNGYTLTVQSYAQMAFQMIKQLRAGTYGAASRIAFSHVGLIGHSAGSEIVELAAGLHPGAVDLVIATAYTHEPFVNNQWLVREWSTDNERALLHDYEYFETNPTIRAHDMYNLANADTDVVALDTRKAHLTPSGEVFSIGPQPSRWVIGTIQKPVLLVLADKDTLFPARFGQDEMALFTLAQDKSLIVAPNDGHVFMLQRNAQVTDSAIADWLDAHNAALPKC